MGGYVVMYCNGPVDWSAGTLKIIPDSTHEAESAIASRATKATCFVRELLRNNGRKLYGPTAMLGDNDALSFLTCFKRLKTLEDCSAHLTGPQRKRLYYVSGAAGAGVGRHGQLKGLAVRETG